MKTIIVGGPHHGTILELPVPLPVIKMPSRTLNAIPTIKEPPEDWSPFMPTFSHSRYEAHRIVRQSGGTSVVYVEAGCPLDSPELVWQLADALMLACNITKRRRQP